MLGHLLLQKLDEFYKTLYFHELLLIAFYNNFHFLFLKVVYHQLCKCHGKNWIYLSQIYEN